MRATLWTASCAIGITLLALTGCGDGDRGDQTTTAATSTPGATPPPTQSQAPTTSQTPTGTASPSPVLEDGRSPVYVTAIDLPGRTVTFDLIQFLTGEEAKRAYTTDHPEDPGWPPNDHYIVNESPRLRTLPVIGAVDVTVIWLDGRNPSAETIPFEELPGYFAGHLAPDDPHLWYDPFWLTVDNGDVVAIEEQFIP
jgi:hypothetical protein